MDLRRFAVAKLQQSLEAIDWPTPLDQDELAAKVRSFLLCSVADNGRAAYWMLWFGQGTQLKDVSAAFAYLLTLQLSQQGSADSKKEGGQQLTGDLWAMDCVLDAVLVRFRYHFERDESATNRMAKPEWMLTSVLEQSRAHERFCTRVLTPELRKRRDTLHCSDAHILLLSGLITAAQHQLRKRLDTLVAVGASFGINHSGVSINGLTLCLHSTPHCCATPSTRRCCSSRQWTKSSATVRGPTALTDGNIRAVSTR